MQELLERAHEFLDEVSSERLKRKHAKVTQKIEKHEQKFKPTRGLIRGFRYTLRGIRLRDRREELSQRHKELHGKRLHPPEKKEPRGYNMRVWKKHGVRV